MWRTLPKSDIGYLIQAASDAYSIADDDFASKRGWDYGCDYQVLYKFQNPITAKDLRENPYLQDWGAYKAHFQQRVFQIQPDYWNRLNQLASKKNPNYRDFIKGVQHELVVDSIDREQELEESLFQDLNILKPFGYDLEIYVDLHGVVGRQYVCKGNGGRIDLLCYDHKRKQYVVIELKNVRAGQNTFGQACNYMGWVQDRIAKGTPVIGLVISRGYDTKFESSLKVTNKVFHLDITQMGFK